MISKVSQTQRYVAHIFPNTWDLGGKNKGNGVDMSKCL